MTPIENKYRLSEEAKIFLRDIAIVQGHSVFEERGDELHCITCGDYLYVSRMIEQNGHGISRACVIQCSQSNRKKAWRDYIPEMNDLTETVNTLFGLELLYRDPQ